MTLAAPDAASFLHLVALNKNDKAPSEAILRPFPLCLDGVGFDPLVRDLKTFTAGKFVVFQREFNIFIMQKYIT